ncbi:MAG TPA: HRDC domain-containing protein [Anaerolineaceae bacterium]|nr:HRDC domain-containing protein [Longilinea sp.]HQL39225.1 HRDC domain-containing protein [Anaerolineaceae bacterium]
MISHPTAPPTWVDTPLRLRQMVADISGYAHVAVDTESNSLYAYQEQVCLIQFSTGDRDYLVDPLSLPNLSSLQPFFESTQIEKIFHAAEYDLICLRRDFGFQVNHLFDTMQAARILGKKAFGLGSILSSELQVEIDKRYQRANWGLRPLPPAMLDYARLDTYYLIPLRACLFQQLEQENLTGLALEDFQRFRLVEIPESKEMHNSGIWRMVGNRDFSPQQAAVLNQLWLYREQRAQQADLPRFKILSDSSLLDIASTCPQTLIELTDAKILSASLLQRHGAQILQAVQRGLNSPPIYRSNSHRPDDAYLDRLDLLRRWRKTAGESMGVESDVILPRETMDTIAQENPQSLLALGRIMEHLPWRFQRYGSQILAIIHHQEPDHYENHI